MKPSSLLNPCAPEWRNTHPHNHHHHHHLPPPHEVAWHVPPQLPRHHPVSFYYGLMSYYVPQPWSCNLVYYVSPPYSSPAARPFYGGEKKYAARLEEGCEMVKVEGQIVEGKKGTTAPPPVVEWKVRKSGGASSRGVSPSRTTVMIKNIPNQLRRDFMLELIDGYCKAHSLEYDFMYLPMDFCSNDNLGYAFVNFTSGDFALKFKEVLHNYKWGDVVTDKGLYTSKKVCFLTWARVQGKEKLVKRFEDTIFECEDGDFLPVVFDPPRGGSNHTAPVVVGRLKKQIGNPTDVVV